MGHDLSPMLQEIASVIGRDGAITLANARGGTRVYIPATVADDHWLAQTIGAQLARKLADHFSIDGRIGARVDLPLPPRETAMVGHNLSSREAARELGITQRTVHRRRARWRDGRK